MALEMYQSYFLKKSISKYLMSSRMITCTKKLRINYMFFTEQKTVPYKRETWKTLPQQTDPRSHHQHGDKPNQMLFVPHAYMDIAVLR